MAKKNIRAIRKRNGPPIVRVSEALADYYASVRFKKLAIATKANYRHFLGVFAAWCDSHELIQDLKTRDWRAIASSTGLALHEVNDQVVYLFLEHIKATHKPSRADSEEIADWTLVTYTKRIKTFLNWCLIHEIYADCVQPVTVGRIEVPELHQEVITTFSDEQIAAFFAACEKEESEHLQVRDKAILSLLLDSGIREEELTKVTIGDVVLRAKDSYIKVEGKGGKYGEVGIGQQARLAIGKYVRQFREPTVEHAFRRLRGALPTQQYEQELKVAVAGAPLFVSRYGEALTPNGIYQLVRRLGQWAGIEGARCSPHTWRHTFALRTYLMTRDIKRVSQLLRHSRVDVTETYLRSLLQSQARQGAPSILDELNHL